MLIYKLLSVRYRGVLISGGGGGGWNRGVPGVLISRGWNRAVPLYTEVS